MTSLQARLSATTTVLNWLGAVVALVFLYLGSASADPEAYAAAVAKVQRLVALDAQQDQLVLESRYGCVGSYDELVRVLEESERLLMRGEADDVAFAGDTEAAETRLLAARAAFHEKHGLIETFKSRNAVLANALRYLPSALGAALSDAVPELDPADARSLVADVVRFTLRGDEESLDKLARRFEKVESAPVGQGEVGSILAQIRNLGEVRARTDELVSAILHHRSGAELTALEEYMVASYGVGVRRAAWHRHALYGLAMALLLYGAWIFSSLKRAEARLNEANATLEQRISDRTRALNAQNRALEAEVAQRASVEHELRKRNQDLDEFTYIASHDLQEPLRKLSSFSQMLERDAGQSLPPRAVEDLGYITDAAARMQRLVQDLLTLSRAGKREIEFRRLDPRECVDEALAGLAERVEETSANVQIGPLPGVFADRAMLTQLFENLIGNALKFVAGPVPSVSIAAVTRNHMVTFRVSDNGIGIKPEFREKVFAPFKRLHGRGDYPGTGIGLSICAKAIERHGGRIWVESVLGEGATFLFTLPAIQSKEDRFGDDADGPHGHRLAG